MYDAITVIMLTMCMVFVLCWLAVACVNIARQVALIRASGGAVDLAVPLWCRICRSRHSRITGRFNLRQQAAVAVPTVQRTRPPPLVTGSAVVSSLPDVTAAAEVEIAEPKGAPATQTSLRRLSSSSRKEDSNDVGWTTLNPLRAQRVRRVLLGADQSRSESLATAVAAGERTFDRLQVAGQSFKLKSES